MLSAAERAQMLAQVQQLGLSETTVKVLAPTVGSDDEYGRSTLEWPDPDDVTAVPGRVWLRSVREQRDGVWVQVSEWVARVGLDVAVSRDDRVLDVATGRQFDVAAVYDDNSHVGLLWQLCRLRAVEPEVV